MSMFCLRRIRLNKLIFLKDTLLCRLGENRRNFDLLDQIRAATLLAFIFSIKLFVVRGTNRIVGFPWHDPFR